MSNRASPSFRILLVENDPVASHFYKISLEETKQFPSFVEEVLNVEQAFEKLNHQKFDLLLIDCDFEEDSGSVGLLDELQRHSLSLPFILLGSVDDDFLRQHAIEAGAADFIIKDKNSYHDLSQKLREACDRFSKRETVQDRRNGMPNGRQPSRGNESLDFQSRSSVNGNGHAPSNSEIQDKLTGLYTHSYLHDRILLEYSRVSRYQYPFSCGMLDIDHFKMINQQYGHAAGDQLLTQCATVLLENCRLSDIITRYGGEEFALILPHVNYAGAMELANRLRRVFSEKIFKVNDMNISLTVSVGIASYPEDSLEHCSDIMDFANQALFRAKAQGRNQVTCYKDIMAGLSEALPELHISDEKILQFQRRMSEISDMARKAYIDASKALIMALENKDSFTAGHAASCGKYALQVAQALGMKVEDAEVVQHAALLHDIGKICIPDHILLKPGKLTLQEFENMKQHPYLGYKILKPIKFLQEEAILVLHHHEWFNGEGYPCHLKGDQIPLGARIIAVIDTYDTIRQAGGRYKKTSTVEAAVNELIACSGKQFDPQVVHSFIECLKARGELTTSDYDHARLATLLAA